MDYKFRAPNFEVNAGYGSLPNLTNAAVPVYKFADTCWPCEANTQQCLDNGCSPTDTRLHTFYCCGEMKASALMASLFYGRYLELFRRFLAQPYTRACSLAGAVDQLLGATSATGKGVLRDYLQADVDFWRARTGRNAYGMRVWSLDHEVGFGRGRIVALHCHSPALYQGLLT